MNWYAYNLHKNRILANWHVADVDGNEVCTLKDSGTEASNARLIAAAPELLAALEAIVENYRLGEFTATQPDGQPVNFDSAIEAIAKAKGQTK